MDINQTIPFDWITSENNREVGNIEPLAASIRSLGLLQPIRLCFKREHDAVVVDGRRRFAALQSLGRTSLEPGEWVEHTDSRDRELAAAAFSANVERKNLSLAEEVRQLNELNKHYNIPELAALFGRTESYVALRLHLASLSPKWQAVLAAPEEYPQWTPAKLELIAREDEAIQENFGTGWRLDATLTEKEIREFFSEARNYVSNFVFDKRECLACTKRTSCSSLLFPEFADSDHDQCLDEKCYLKKFEAHLKELIKENPRLTLCETEFAGNVPSKYVAGLHFKPGTVFYAKVRLPKDGEAPNAICFHGQHAGKLVVLQKEKAAGKAVKAEPDPAAELKELEDKRAKAISTGTASHFGKRLRESSESIRVSIDKLNDYLRLAGYFTGVSAWNVREDHFKEAMKDEYPLTTFARKLFASVASLAEYQSNYWDEKNLAVLREFARMIGEEDLYHAARRDALADNPVTRKMETLKFKAKCEKIKNERKNK